MNRLMSERIISSRPTDMSAKQPPHRRCHNNSNVLELLHPGTFVTIDDHPNDLPPFQVIECSGGFCLVRQQSWGQHVQWEVEHRRLRSA